MTSHSGNRYADYGRDFTDFSLGANPKVPDTAKMRFGEIFCGMGVFSYAAVQTFRMTPVFAQEPDQDARASYAANFGLEPWAEIPDELDASEFDIDILLGRVPKTPGEFDQVIAPVVRALRPRGVMLGVALAPLMELTPDGLDVPTSEPGLMWTYFRKRMRELGYRVSRLVFNSGAIHPTNLREHRLFSATRINREFPWRRIVIAVLPIPGSEEDLRQQEIRTAIREVIANAEGMIWDVTEANAEKFRAEYQTDNMDKWNVPVGSPNFPAMLEAALPIELAEAAVGIMAEFVGS